MSNSCSQLLAFERTFPPRSNKNINFYPFSRQILLCCRPSTLAPLAVNPRCRSGGKSSSVARSQLAAAGWASAVGWQPWLISIIFVRRLVMPDEPRSRHVFRQIFTVALLATTFLVSSAFSPCRSTCFVRNHVQIQPETRERLETRQW